MEPITLLEGLLDSLDPNRDRFAVQKLQNVIHYLTAPIEYAACYSVYGSLVAVDEQNNL